MAMNTTADGYLLPCGRDAEQVWEHLERGSTDEHERACVHCATARRSLAALREITQVLVADDAAPPPDLTGRIMNAVRAELRRGTTVALPTGEPGEVEVSSRAVAVVLRFAADGVPGVRARRCKLVRLGAAENGGDEVAVELGIAVAHRSMNDQVLAEVRRRVLAAARSRVGLTVARLDLVVDDLYDV